MYSQIPREIHNQKCVLWLKNCNQLLSFSLLLVVASRTAQNPGKIPPKEDCNLIVCVCWHSRETNRSYELCNPPLPLHASLLSGVCSLPFRKLLHHFKVQNVRHHCQRLAELFSIFPALKSIYHLLCPQNFLSDEPGLAESELSAGLDCSKTHSLAPQRQRMKFYG